MMDVESNEAVAVQHSIAARWGSNRGGSGLATTADPESVIVIQIDRDARSGS
jgi:hypothetical protein